eukprot:1161129-Pelagomonas_calceolata.AAC.8
MDRFFERAFNKVHAQVNAVQSAPPPNAGKGDNGQPGKVEQQPPEPEVKNAIQAILLHWKNKEYFKHLTACIAHATIWLHQDYKERD